MEKKLITTAAIFGLLAVVLGAFAAHGLQKFLEPIQIDSFKTGVRYQFYHAFLLLFLANSKLISEKSKQYIFWFVLIGVILFSGSIYVLNIDFFVFGFDIPVVPILTPIGGVLLIIAWVLLIISALKIKKV